jgi:hypothetical protein
MFVFSSLFHLSLVLQALSTIASKEGFRGMYAGIMPRILWSALFGGVGFASFEACKSMLGLEVDRPERYKSLPRLSAESSRRLKEYRFSFRPPWKTIGKIRKGSKNHEIEAEEEKTSTNIEGKILSVSSTSVPDTAASSSAGRAERTIKRLIKEERIVKVSSSAAHGGLSMPSSRANMKKINVIRNKASSAAVPATKKGYVCSKGPDGSMVCVRSS